MRRISTTFVPLASGEKPGDPELGGWRPLAPCLLTRHEELRHSPVSYATKAVQSLSLMQAVQFVAARLWGFQLRQTIQIVARHLAN